MLPLSRKTRIEEPQINIEEIRGLTMAMKKCAKCLDGNPAGPCEHERDCDDYAMDLMLRCVSLTETYQKRMTERGIQTIRSRMNGFRCQNQLTREYQCKVSKALAQAAQELQYTVEILLGRGNV